MGVPLLFDGVLDVLGLRFALCFFFFNDTATTEIYTLSLHDALPIWRCGWFLQQSRKAWFVIDREIIRLHRAAIDAVCEIGRAHV